MLDFRAVRLLATMDELGLKSIGEALHRGHYRSTPAAHRCVDISRSPGQHDIPVTRAVRRDPNNGTIGPRPLLAYRPPGETWRTARVGRTDRHRDRPGSRRSSCSASCKDRDRISRKRTPGVAIRTQTVSSQSREPFEQTNGYAMNRSGLPVEFHCRRQRARSFVSSVAMTSSTTTYRTGGGRCPYLCVARRGDSHGGRRL